MAVHPVKVGAKLRVYLPKEIAAVLKIEPGDYVVLRLADGKVSMEKLR